MGRHLAFDATPIRPDRVKPVPPGFAEVFVCAGWRGVEIAFGARTAVNVRWLRQCGCEALRAAREQYRTELRAMRRELC